MQQHVWKPAQGGLALRSDPPRLTCTMLSVVNIRAQISSVIEALSKAAVAEIAKVVEDGTVVLRMEICQRDDEILKLKDSIDILSNELKAANGGGQDRGSILLTDDDLQGSDGEATFYSTKSSVDQLDADNDIDL